MENSKTPPSRSEVTRIVDIRKKEGAGRNTITHELSQGGASSIDIQRSMPPKRVAVNVFPKQTMFIRLCYFLTGVALGSGIVSWWLFV